jgi:hypothetical protein
MNEKESKRRKRKRRKRGANIDVKCDETKK